MYYKVCHIIDGKLKSAYSIGAKLSYQVGAPTVPIIPGSKLFVFDNKEAAIKWCPDRSTFGVFPCLVTNPTEPPPYISSDSFYDYDNDILWVFTRWWQFYNLDQPPLSSEMATPPHTVLVDSVTILK